MDAGPGARAIDRVQDRKELVGLVAVPEGGEGDDGPDGGMGVLPAILANPRRVPLDVARIEIGAIERRREEQDQFLPTTNEIFLDGTHRARRATAFGGARDHAPQIGRASCRERVWI